MSNENFELIAAVHTPFTEGGGLHLEAVPRQAAWLSAHGVNRAFVAGTTGESLSLSVSERISLAEAWHEVAASHGLGLVIHVGATSLVDAGQLAKHAGSLGVSGISAMAPSYFKPKDLAALTEFLAEVAAAAGTTPFYFYDIPSWTGVRFRASELLARHADDIPNFAGIKYTSDDWIDFQRCVAIAGDRYHLFWGCDEALLAGLAFGATGAIGSTYAFMASEAREIIAAHGAGQAQRARQAQQRVVRIIDAIASFGFLPASKVVLAELGLDCGSVRRPLTALTEEKRHQLRRACAAAGFSLQAETVNA